jgi:hypothetical protein
MQIGDGEYLIWLCDICGYSQLTSDDQRESVIALWDAIAAAILRLERPAIWGTGDGAYVIVRATDEERGARMLSFALDLKEQFRKRDLRVRSALHQGTVKQVSVANPRDRRRRSIFAGAGLNLAARMVNLAGPNQIVCSQAFIERLDQSPMFARQLPRSLRSSLSKGYISVELKHGIGTSVVFDSSEPSPAMARIAIATALLQESVRNALTAIALELDVPSSAVRISLFRPFEDEKGNVTELIPTPFRVAGSGLPLVARQKGGTRYEAGARACGPGLAFERNEPALCLNLPPPTQNLDQYCEDVQAKWNCPIEDVRAWGHRPRNLVAWPARLVSGSRPECVLCLDYDGSEDITWIEGMKRGESFARTMDSIAHEIAVRWRMWTTSA